MTTIHRMMRRSVTLAVTSAITVATFAGVQYLRCDLWVNSQPDATNCDPPPNCASPISKCKKIVYSPGGTGGCVSASYFSTCNAVTPFEIEEQTWKAICVNPSAYTQKPCSCPTNPAEWELDSAKKRQANCYP